jgi:hypothetical protein
MICPELRTLVINDHRPNTIKILETALTNKGAALTKLVHNLDLTEYQGS